MSLIEFSYKSKYLEKENPMTVILPDPYPPDEEGVVHGFRGIPQNGFPTLFLLHGLSDDQTSWMRNSSIERYAESYGLAVVMPNVDQSFYTNMACGQDYWKYISKEVPEVSRKYFPISDRREENFVAGLSMGGYGAFKWVLNRPREFAAAASLSGSLDVVSTIQGIEDEEELKKLKWVFGKLEQIKESEDDLIYMAKEVAESDVSPPKLFQCVGTDDFLYESNLSFKRVAEELSLKLTYKEKEGAAHEWAYWDEMIQKVLDWLPL